MVQMFGFGKRKIRAMNYTRHISLPKEWLRYHFTLPFIALLRYKEAEMEFMADTVALATWALVIVTAISTIIYAIMTYRELSIMKRDKERNLIVEIVKNFLIFTINKLNLDKGWFNNINNTSFPEFLVWEFGIDNRFLKGAIFDNFTERKPLLKRRILRYNELCSKINEQVQKLEIVARKKGITTLIPSDVGTRCEITEQYKAIEKVKILEDTGLNENVKDIKDAIEKEGLYNRAEKLILKLEKIKENYKKKYYLTDKEMEVEW